MAILPVRTGNGDIVSIPDQSQAAYVPVLGECCGESCQTVVGGGVITVVETLPYGPYPSATSTWRSPGIAFIMPDGGYFAVVAEYSASIGDPSTSAIYVTFTFIDADGDEYSTDVSFDGASVADNDTWEIRLSWCDDCTVVVEVHINAILFTSATVTNVCDVAGPSSPPLTPAAAGFIVWATSAYASDPDYINISDFSLACGALTPSGPQVVLVPIGG